jgi:electron transport complex protein RnfB
VTGAATPGLAERLDALLPQTQCTRCGFEGCRPYADAMARGEAAINRCPPGGRSVVAALAGLLEVPELPLDASCGEEGPPQVALIDEAACIGCAKCIDACPTDAITGARKWMHTIIAADCSGCELCLPPCPVDCIALVPAPGLPRAVLEGRQLAERAQRFRALFEARRDRQGRDHRRWRAALDARLAAVKDDRGTPPP